MAAGSRRTGDYLDEWLVGVRPTPVVSAWTNHRSLLDLYVRPRIGSVQIAGGERWPRPCGSEMIFGVGHAVRCTEVPALAGILVLVKEAVPADPRRKERRAIRSRRQPLPWVTPDNKPEIYAMDLRNPLRSQSTGRTGTSTLPTTRRTTRSRTPCVAPAGHGKWTVIRRTGQLRLAVLRDRRTAPRRLRLCYRGVRGSHSTAPTR